MASQNRWRDIDIASNLALSTPLTKMPLKVLGLPNADEFYYKFLYFLAKEIQAKTVLELGVYKGTGLGHLAMGSQLAVGVDHKRGEWEENLKDFLNCRVELSDSLKFLETYLGPPFDIIHIDTIHESAHVARELELSMTRLSTGSIICVDDIDYSEDMWAWWSKLDLPKRDAMDLHSTGFGVIVPDG